jgi:hypothetical protein
MMGLSMVSPCLIIVLNPQTHSRRTCVYTVGTRGEGLGEVKFLAVELTLTGARSPQLEATCSGLTRHS